MVLIACTWVMRWLIVRCVSELVPLLCPAPPAPRRSQAGSCSCRYDFSRRKQWWTRAITVSKRVVSALSRTLPVLLNAKQKRDRAQRSRALRSERALRSGGRRELACRTCLVRQGCTDAASLRTSHISTQSLSVIQSASALLRRALAVVEAAHPGTTRSTGGDTYLELIEKTNRAGAAAQQAWLQRS